MTATATATVTGRDLEARIDVRILLSALWASTMLIFAYVDIFSFYRADVLEAALDGRVATTAFLVDQTFLASTVGFILVPSLMVILSLVLPRGINRVLTIVAALGYTIMIIVSCVNETWVYFLVGSVVEVALLLVIIRTSWRWQASGRPTPRTS